MTGPPASASLLRALVTLTLISGLVDAVSYLGLGHVFTANMTGNVVILGFAAAGAPGFSVPASLASLAAFLLGAVCAGRVATVVTGRGRLLVFAMTVEAVFVAAAAAIAASAGPIAAGWPRYSVIAVLAFAMGVRNATVRRIAVPDMTTTVLTMTLTGLAADSSLAGGDNTGAARRCVSVAAMLAGAVAGAAMFLHARAGLPLLVAALVVAATTVIFWRGGEGGLATAPAAGPGEPGRMSP
ncbi:MAG TPA: YoaK family protein [Streptosporangiaceae bacterium]